MKHYGTGSSRERHDHVRRQRRKTAIASAARATEARSTVLTEAEEAMVAALLRHILLRLGDCLYALQSSILHLTRSALHRCLQLHNI